MKNYRIALTLIAAWLSAACTPSTLVKPDPMDMTAPDPVEIHGKLTGGGSESNHGAKVPFDFGPLTLLPSPTGQLEITSTATDNQSGIKSFEIFSNDRHCRWDVANGGWTTVGPEPTKIRSSKVLTPDSNGMLPVTLVALANIQVGAELGSFDKVTMQFFGAVKHGASMPPLNIGPITYTAVSANVPAANRLDGCP